MDRVHHLQKAPRLRRPSISDQNSFLGEECTIRRSVTMGRNSRNTRSGTRVSGMVTSTSGRLSRHPSEEEERDVVQPLRSSKQESPKDYEKILSIQYMINFDQVFVSDYSLQEATLSSIELMKQEIAEKFEQSERRYSQSYVGDDSNIELRAGRERFKELRRQKLLKDVWNKQHRYRTTFPQLRQDMSAMWMEQAQSCLSDINPEGALIRIEKYLYYNPGYASAYLMKSVAFQLMGDLRMASIAIKTAQEMGLSHEDQAGNIANLVGNK